MRAAARELVASSQGVNLIAEQVGYSDALYFSKRFRQFFGQSPSAYRAHYQEQLRLE